MKASTPLEHDDDDADTTAAAKAPAARSIARLNDEEEDDDDFTVRKPLEMEELPSGVKPPTLRPSRRPTPGLPSARPPASRPPVMTSKKATAVGLGGAMVASARPGARLPDAELPDTKPGNLRAPTAAATSVTSGTPSGSGKAPNTTPSQTKAPDTRPASAASSARVPVLHEADAKDDSITTTAPAARIDSILRPPGAVKIVEMDGAPADGAEDSDIPTVISGAPAPRSLGAPPTLASRESASLVPRTQASPTSEADEADDSVTTRAPAYLDEPTAFPRPPPSGAPPAPVPAAVAAYDEEESVTTRAPALDERDGVPVLDDGTEGTTKQLRPGPIPQPYAGEDAREVSESVTRKAPPQSVPLGGETEVMIGAPVKPPVAVTPAPQSESGLRIAPTPPPAADHASLAAILPPGESRKDANPFAATMAANAMPAFPIGKPEAPPKSYALVVGVVAAVSLIVPIALFLALRGGDGPQPPRTPNDLAPDPVLRDETTRARATPTTPAPPPSTSTSTHRPTWPPRRR